MCPCVERQGSLRTGLETHAAPSGVRRAEDTLLQGGEVGRAERRGTRAFAALWLRGICIR